ncbi:MAG: hypothetical protein AB1597_02805 [Chloroflexota bacterium]
MNNFGIGLALAMSGFACYLLADNAGKWLASLQGMADFAKVFSMVWPWLCLAVVIIGVGWFWILSPLLYYTRPYPGERSQK